MRSPEKYFPLISSTSILIISGFMIGISIGKLSGSDLTPFLLAGGLAGFLAFLVLDFTAEKRAEKKKLKLQNEIELKLERHAHSVSNVNLPSARISASELNELINRQKKASQTSGKRCSVENEVTLPAS